MRIDGFQTPISADRGPRPGTAVTPYREAQREVENRQEQARQPLTQQGFEPQTPTRKVQASTELASYAEFAAKANQGNYQSSGLTARAAQALASYSSTATFVHDYDAPQVLGLDLYV